MRKTILGLLVGAFAAPVFGQAPEENAPIKVKAIVRDDGTRVESKVDAGAGTAEEVTYNAAGKVMQRIEFKLDAQGLPATGTVFNAKGQPALLIALKRDTAGRVSEREESNPAGQLQRRLVFQYDSRGQIAKVSAFDGQGNPIQTGPARKDKKRAKN